MSELTEFLLARIAEDEAAAWARIDAEVAYLRSDGLPEATRETLLEMKESNSWRRPLAECAAKRSIIDLHAAFGRVEGGRIGQGALKEALKDLATVYKDHPDYQSEWS